MRRFRGRSVASVLGFVARQHASDYSLSKNLKLRGVIFSLEVLVGANKSVATGPRDATTATPVSSGGAHNTYDTSREIQGISTVVTKYGDKLRQRLGGASLESVSGSGQAAQDRRAGGDAKRLMASKKAVQQQEEGGGRWLLVEGMGNILDYTSFRTIPLCCFPLSSQTDALLKTFLSQVHETPWFYLGSVATATTAPAPTIDGSILAAQFVEMENKFISNGISPKQLLVVSSNEQFLALSKSRGFLTCRYRPLDSLYGQVSTDMVATNALEIQDCLEELNGVALRASVFSSRTY